MLTDAEVLSKTCESPIEMQFAPAFLALCGRYDVKTYTEFTKPEEPESVAFIPQMVLGPYRADFGILVRHKYGNLSKIVVECDGHQWHDRNKFQASADRARDRHMKIAGWDVLRFTGSDIHRGARRCAGDVWTLIEHYAFGDIQKHFGPQREAMREEIEQKKKKWGLA